MCKCMNVHNHVYMHTHAHTHRFTHVCVHSLGLQFIHCLFPTVRDEDAEFDADDLGPDVLSMLDEVECKLMFD